jgi:hypothetical protein
LCWPEWVITKQMQIVKGSIHLSRITSPTDHFHDAELVKYTHIHRHTLLSARSHEAAFSQYVEHMHTET